MDVFSIVNKAVDIFAEEDREKNVFFSSSGMGDGRLAAKKKRSKNYRTTMMDMRMYNLVTKIHRMSPYARVATDAVLNEVLRDDMQLFRDTKSIKMSVSMELYLQSKMRPFLVDCYEKIMTLGIVPYKIVKEKLPNGETIFYPIVPKVEFAVAIVQHMKDYTVQYEFVPKTRHEYTLEEKADPTVRFITGWGFDPTPEGQLTSMVASGINTDVFVNMINNFTLEAESERSNPRIVTETEKIATGIDDFDLMNGRAFYADRDANENRREDQFTVTEEQAQLAQANYLAYQKNVQELMIGRGRRIADSRVKQVDYPLPPGQKYVRANLPTARADLRDIQVFLQEVIFSIYGYPRVMSMESRHGKTTQDPNKDAFSRTILKWKHILSDIATRVYDEAYGPSELMDSLREKYQDRKEEVRKLSSKDLYSLRQQSRLRIVLPVVTNETHDVLFDKYVKGFIDYSDVMNFSRRQSGLASVQADEIKDPLSANERKELMLGGLGKRKETEERPASGGISVTDRNPSSTESDHKKKKAKQT